jgi:pyridoxine 4-dehydrogenase
VLPYLRLVAVANQRRREGVRVTYAFLSRSREQKGVGAVSEGPPDQSRISSNLVSAPPAAAAGTVSIGSDLVVNRLGFGAMRLTGPGLFGDFVDRDRGLVLLRRAAEGGVNFIDTADAYGPHTNEVLIHDALHPYPPSLVIATKGGLIRGRLDDATKYSVVGNPEYLRQCAYLSARRLGVEQIALYYLHSPNATDFPFEDQVGTLADLRAEGLIRHIGLSNVSAEQFRTARQIVDISAVTARYNFVDRTAGELLSTVEAVGTVFSPWYPTTLAEGGANAAKLSRVLGPICKRHQATLPQIAIAWLLRRSPFMVPIPGTASLEHLDANLAAAAIDLAPEEVTAIDELGVEPPDRPA